jgi:predicted metal-dependent hydrolase
MGKIINSIIYRGQEHEVKPIVYQGSATKIIFRDHIFNVYINNKIAKNKVEEEMALQLRIWMTEKGSEIIKRRTAEYSVILGVNYNNIRIKDTKTRWGSCSSKCNLNFNYRILMAPEKVMDYIIIHELCHLKHMNHGKQFWETVALYMPDYKKQKEWLKVNGMKLYVI